MPSSAVGRPLVTEQGPHARGEALRAATDRRPTLQLRRETFSETSTPRLLALTAAHAGALADTRLVVVTDVGHGQAIVAPAGRVGTVRCGDLQVEVWPKDKVRLAHLLFMLGYAADPGFRPETVSADGYDDLWPALAESLARLTERALAGGILQGYRTVDEASTVVRGRVRVAEQLRRKPGLLLPLEISHDDYQADISENRILRTALRRMRAVPRLDGRAAARIAHLDNQLDGVSVLSHRDGVPPWRATRLNARYVPALRLAELVLRHASARTDGGGVQVAAFVVSMWKVFEDFVTTALREALAQRGLRACAQQRWHFDAPRDDDIPRVPMAVDLLAYDGRRPVMIYDAKYKAADASGRYPNADLYQMLAYGTTTRLDQAVLVYAAGGAPVRRRVVGSPMTITEWPLDLSRPPAELLARIDEIAREAVRVAAATSGEGMPHAVAAAV